MSNGIATVVVNNLRIAWSEDERRVEKLCKECRKPTRGRVEQLDANLVSGKRLVPSCMGCAFTGAFKKAFKVLV